MNLIGVTVEVKKMLSDGDYGHEAAQVSYTAELEDGDIEDDVTAELLQRARAHCREELQRSESLNIRRKINTKPRICNACGLELDDEIRMYLHPACDERLRAERAALRDGNRERELEEMPF